MYGLFHICVQIYINVRESALENLCEGLRDQNIVQCGREGVVDLISPLIIFFRCNITFCSKKSLTFDCRY